jgi:hypothetical protein
MITFASYNSCDILQSPDTGLFFATHFLARAKVVLPEAAKRQVRLFMSKRSIVRVIAAEKARLGSPVVERVAKGMFLSGFLMYTFIQYVSARAAEHIRPAFESFFPSSGSIRIEDVTGQEESDDDDADNADESSAVAASFNQVMPFGIGRFEEFMQALKANTESNQQVVVSNQQMVVSNQQMVVSHRQLEQRMVEENAQLKKKMAEMEQNNAEREMNLKKRMVLDHLKHTATLRVIAKAAKRRKKIEQQYADDEIEEMDNQVQAYAEKYYERDLASIAADEKDPNYDTTQPTWTCHECLHKYYNRLSRKMCGACHRYNYEASMRIKRENEEKEVFEDDEDDDDDDDDKEKEEDEDEQ